MPLYLFSLSHSSPLFLFFFIPPHPYITLFLSIFFLSIVLLFSFLTVTYVLMDNFLSLFYLKEPYIMLFSFMILEKLHDDTADFQKTCNFVLTFLWTTIILVFISCYYFIHSCNTFM